MDKRSSCVSGNKLRSWQMTRGVQTRRSGAAGCKRQETSKWIRGEKIQSRHGALRILPWLSTN